MKNSRKIICIMLGLGFAVFGGSAVAGEHQMRQEQHRSSAAAGQHQAGQHPGMHAREHSQAARGGQGVHSGQLTKGEARGLAKDQRDIRHEARGDRADGKFTREERKDGRQDMNGASRDIYREKHDAGSRPHQMARPGEMRGKFEKEARNPEQRHETRGYRVDGVAAQPGAMHKGLENMPPEQRQAMRERFERASPEQRPEMREKMMGGHDESKRREMRERFEGMSPEERKEFKREMRERMTPEQRERAMDRRGGVGQDS